MIVVKFGGSLLKDAEQIRACAKEVVRQAERDPVVVVSALNGVTDLLIENASRALYEKADPSDLRKLHLQTVEELGLRAELIERLLFDVEVLLRGVQQVGELSVRVFDRLLSYGERLSSVIFAQTLREEGLPAFAVPAFDIGFITDSRHTRATPLPGIEEKIRRSITERSGLPVVTGFIGKDEDGNITTIGRNGSDLTASIIAAAVDAEELQIYTDTEGLMSADPRVESDAERVERLTYQEAAELAHFGATVLHPKTLIPIMAKRIRLKLRPLTDPEKQTEISDTETSTTPVITSRERVALINIYTHRLSPILDDIHRFSRLLDEYHLTPLAITNTLSTCTVVVEEAPFRKRVAYRVKGFWVEFPTEEEKLLKERFSAFKEGVSEFAHTSLTERVALLCSVSESFRKEPSFADTALRLLRQEGVEPLLFWTTASRISLMLAVDRDSLPTAINTLHSFLIHHADETYE